MYRAAAAASTPPSGHRATVAALAASLPGVAITGAAAANANALAIWADLLLTLIDVAALVALWWAARHRDRRAEGAAIVTVGLCMTLSLAVVAGLAIQRLIAGGTVVEGPGIALALAQNAAYALVNGWLLWRCRRSPGTGGRTQRRLFCDKLCSNLLLAGSLAATCAVGDAGVAAAIDGATGVLLVAVSAWWAAPVLAIAWHRMRRRQGRRLRRAALLLAAMASAALLSGCATCAGWERIYNPVCQLPPAQPSPAAPAGRVNSVSMMNSTASPTPMVVPGSGMP